MKRLPRYPIYIPSKGRADKCLTANILVRDGVPFYLVIEKQEYEQYTSHYGEDKILVLPFSNRGSVIPARNWIKDHSIENGDKRHWQLDDNMDWFRRLYKGKRIPCEAGIGLMVTEDFVDRYLNIAIAGLNYESFVFKGNIPPFYLNTHIYSCTLVLNEIPHRWRGKYNEDTDICLQVLADGWCTIAMNAFMVHKVRTMVMKGGNTDELYHGDGRLKMARSLERKWPGVVETKRRFQRPQHVVKNAWTRFDNELIRDPEFNWDALPDKNEYGMMLVQKRDKIKSPELRRWVKRARKKKQ